MSKNDEVKTLKDMYTDTNFFNQLDYYIRLRLATMNTIKVCQVENVNADDDGNVLSVDVRNMVLEVDGSGEPINAIIWKEIPILQIQGGQAGLLIRYKKGDIVLVGFCDRDIQAVKRSRKAAAPTTPLTTPLSGGICLGAVLFTAPTVYVKITDEGIEFEGNVVANQDINIKGSLTVDGDITATGNIESTDGDVVASGISLKNHTHQYTKATAAQGLVSAPDNTGAAQ